MRVEYEQAKSDITWFWRHHIVTAAYLRRLWWAGVALGVGVNAVITWIRWSGRPGQWKAVAWSSVSIVLLMVALALLVLPVWMWLGSRILLREGQANGVLGRHTVVLEDGEIREETPYGSQIAQWRAIHRVESTKDFLLIYVQPAMAHVIPRRAFASESDFRAFADHASELWERASAAK